MACVARVDGESRVESGKGAVDAKDYAGDAACAVDASVAPKMCECRGRVSLALAERVVAAYRAWGERLCQVNRALAEALRAAYQAWREHPQR